MVHVRGVAREDRYVRTRHGRSCRETENGDCFSEHDRSAVLSITVDHKNRAVPQCCHLAVTQSMSRRDPLAHFRWLSHPALLSTVTAKAQTMLGDAVAASIHAVDAQVTGWAIRAHLSVGVTRRHRVPPLSLRHPEAYLIKAGDGLPRPAFAFAPLRRRHSLGSPWLPGRQWCAPLGSCTSSHCRTRVVC